MGGCGFGVFDCGGRRGVFVVFWVQVGVHVAAADESPLAEGVAESCEEVCGGGVSGGEVGCRRCTMG